MRVIMRYLRYLALCGALLVPAALAHAQNYDQGYAPDQNYQNQGYQDQGYQQAPPQQNYNYEAPPANYAPEYAAAPEPGCPYGYYPSYPYSCAPYGYWAPNYFVGGVCIGAGPWFRGWGWRPGLAY